MSDIVDKIDETLKDVLGDERVQTAIGLALLWKILRPVMSFIWMCIFLLAIIALVFKYVP